MDHPLNPEDQGTLRESLIRLEAKIDVVLSRHESKIDQLTQAQAETTATLRELDMRTTANALTTAETRTQVAGLDANISNIRADMTRKGSMLAPWIAVAVAVLAVVLNPILAALIHH